MRTGYIKHNCRRRRRKEVEEEEKKKKEEKEKEEEEQKKKKFLSSELQDMHLFLLGCYSTAQNKIYNSLNMSNGLAINETLLYNTMQSLPPPHPPPQPQAEF